MNKKYANLMLVLVTIVWGGGFIATDGALNSITPFYILTIRFLGAAILPLFIAYKDLRKLEKRYVFYGVITGSLLFFAFAFQTFGLSYTTPSKNAFLTASNVIFVPYLLWMLMKRKPKKKEMIASVVCLIGIAMLTLNPEALSLTIGDTFSLICAIFFALHIIALEKYSSHINAFSMTALQMLTAGIIAAICALVFEQPPTSLTSSAIWNVLYLIFVSTLLAYLLQTYAQKFTSANTASLILSMEALFASLFSFLILHEVMSWTMILGAGLIFISILYIEYKPKQRKG